MENNTAKVIDIKNLRAKKVLKEINGIEIYDINCKENADRREQLFAYVKDVVQDIIDSPDKYKEGKIDAYLTGVDTIKHVLPILTNVLLDELTAEELQDILEEPSDDLIETARITGEVFNKALNQFLEVLKKPQSEIEMLIPKDKKAELLAQAKTEEKARKAKKIKEDMEAQLLALESEEDEVDVVEDGE